MNDPTETVPLFRSLEQVSDGWIKKYLLGYELSDKTYFEYESVSRKDKQAYEQELKEARGGIARQADAVSIVGRTLDDRLLLIKEFRYALNDWCIALPAGLKEPGESLIACAERELAEETGYRICKREGKLLYHALDQVGFSSAGLCDETVHMVFAYVEPNETAHCEATECIEAFTVPVADIAHFLKTNRHPLGTRCQLILESFVSDLTWNACRKGAPEHG